MDDAGLLANMPLSVLLAESALPTRCAVGDWGAPWAEAPILGGWYGPHSEMNSVTGRAASNKLGQHIYRSISVTVLQDALC